MSAAKCVALNGSGLSRSISDLALATRPSKAHSLVRRQGIAERAIVDRLPDVTETREKVNRGGSGAWRAARRTRQVRTAGDR